MKGSMDKDVQRILKRDHACYVLITCSAPSDDGRMEVEMHYEGDPALASYLLHSAQDFIDVSEDDVENIL